MLFRRNRTQEPTFDLFHPDGRKASLNLTFKNGEVHIDPDRMSKGSYTLTVSRGKDIESRVFTVS